VAAFPDQCVNKKKSEILFPSRSSGSSGQTLLVQDIIGDRPPMLRPA
jgi:hypothetical protein